VGDGTAFDKVDACSQAELPKPTTSTGRSFQGSPFRYSLECKT
jgi:hypothetical protein